MKKEKQISIFDNIPEATEEEVDREKRLRKKKWSGINSFLNYCMGFVIAGVLVVGCAALALDYQLVKGPSATMTKKWITTISETRRFDFINNLFLSEDEVDEILNAPIATPVNVISRSTQIADRVVRTVSDDGRWMVGDETDDDNDGIIYQEFKVGGSQCYLIAIQDPSRIIIGWPGFFGGNGLVLEDMISQFDALGGINAGGFIDTGGAGSGGYPDGITIINGVEHSTQSIGGVGGFDANWKFHCGDYTIEECRALGLVNAVSFEPVLLQDGFPTYSWGESGANPRTAIGQREDGTVLMLCVDGRQFFSPGLNYEEVAWIMYDYGAVCAINMDGGSSSCMMYEGELKNNPTNAAGGTRYLPTAWLFK